MRIQGQVEVLRAVAVALALSCSTNASPVPRTANVEALHGQQSISPKTKNDASGDPQALFSKGEGALQSGDLAGAEKAFRQVIAMDPNAGGAYANLGVVAMRRKDWGQALSLLEKAARLAPKVSGIRLNIGLAQYGRGDYAAAIAPFTSVLRDQPDSQQARYLLGLCNLFTQHYADAVSTLEPLWPQKSNDFMYLYVLSISANGAGEKEVDVAATRFFQMPFGEWRRPFGFLFVQHTLDRVAGQDTLGPVRFVPEVVSALGRRDDEARLARAQTIPPFIAGRFLHVEPVVFRQLFFHLGDPGRWPFVGLDIDGNALDGAFAERDSEGDRDE